MAQKRTLSPEQDIAANPAENVWVQANAGTGKTSVLVQRLLRILFRSPDIESCGILCLTYTNAGAGEMRNRILAALRKWAMASDDDLRDMLGGVSENKNPTDADIAHARQIFFTYIDNPEILKIKTIHGFCEEILRRFPLEAGISPSWTLVSDTAQRILMQNAFDHLINSSGDARTDAAFEHIVGRVSETAMPELLGMLTSQYKYFFGVDDFDNYRKYFIDTTRYFLNLDSPIMSEATPESLQNIINLAKSEKKPANYITKVVNLTQQYIDKTIDFQEYKNAYLKADGGKIKNIMTKDYMVAEQDRVYQINQRALNQIVFDDTMALFDLSAAFAETYRKLKARQNALDFEDLVLYTRRLFSKPDTMGWVLSQLNISLSYILVDEAQDTAPVQWDIMRMLAGDFFTDGDTSRHPHTMFVVGDTKQSIYGFQGADPRAFAASRDEIATQIAQNMRTIREVPLTQSFRSLAAILNTVDKFFDDPSVVEMTGFANNNHKCFRGDGTGLVELHKLISRATDEIDLNAYIRGIADRIKALIDSGVYAPKDIMVLVQQRVPMAAPLVKELKRRGIDVAGSDRIVLPGFPVIRDMMNLVRFCLNNADDYSLCCVLKSPIFRLTERDIFNVCKIKNDENAIKRRNGNTQLTTVYQVLADTHPEIYNRLTELLDLSATMSPYSFFNNVLSDGVRESMIAALGNQVVDPLEEFMTICLAYERTMTGTLRHFLKWFITGSSEIKRDMDSASGVRIATVHGSKGLEARAVFLIDTIRTPKVEKMATITSELLPPHLRANADKYPTPWIWMPRTNNMTENQAVAVDAVRHIRIAEYYRLLYVAMTRARDALFIYGFTTDKNPPEIAWHTQLWRVLAGDSTDEIIRIEQ